jgi:hypothetical protein
MSSHSGSGSPVAFPSMSRAEAQSCVRVETKSCEGCGRNFFREVGSGMVDCRRCIQAGKERVQRELAERERFKRPLTAGAN